jgi:predicted dehydrogenase
MKEPTTHLTTRREFLVNSGKIAAASALAGAALPYVHAAGTDTIQVALVGCGGRGTGAAENAVSVKNGPVKLVAMADVFENRLNSSYNGLKQKAGDKVDVPNDRKFIGFDAYKKAMDCLKPGDVAIFATPLAFRWVHFTYAIEKGLNVFMEKPLTADGPTSRRLLKLADDASAKNLKCGVGLMSRHSRALQELQKRIEDGEIGDVIFMRGYRMQGMVGSAYSTKWPGNPSELLWQIQRFHSFLWASGGAFSDFNIHIIDHLCWMKNAWPSKVQSVGAKHNKTDADGRPYVDQNFDNYAAEYIFPDGARMLMEGRCMSGCNDIYSSYVHGSKGIAVASHHGDCGMPSSIYKGQTTDRSNMLWTSKIAKDQEDPYSNEWNDLVDAIRNDRPYNEVKRGVQASAVTSMGRMAAHTGQEIEYDDFLNNTKEYAPDVDKLTFESPAPLIADSDGKYPAPMPGIKREQEY